MNVSHTTARHNPVLCRCILHLHYHPRNPDYRGCVAVTPQQGGHSVCMHELTDVLERKNLEANTIPIR
jgi:hypothetical protein